MTPVDHLPLEVKNLVVAFGGETTEEDWKARYAQSMAKVSIRDYFKTQVVPLLDRGIKLTGLYSVTCHQCIVDGYPVANPLCDDCIHGELCLNCWFYNSTSSTFPNLGDDECWCLGNADNYVCASWDDVKGKGIIPDLPTYGDFLKSTQWKENQRMSWDRMVVLDNMAYTTRFRVGSIEESDDEGYYADDDTIRQIRNEEIMEMRERQMEAEEIERGGWNEWWTVNEVEEIDQSSQEGSDSTSNRPRRVRAEVRYHYASSSDGESHWMDAQSALDGMSWW